jgi:hypothetical protein
MIDELRSLRRTYASKREAHARQLYRAPKGEGAEGHEAELLRCDQLVATLDRMIKEIQPLPFDREAMFGDGMPG